MTITEMRQVLAERNVQLTKSLGQNFLFDQNQLRKIAAAAELTKADKVLEIGPGLGPLTELLLEQVGEVPASEKDQRLVEILSERFAASCSPPSPTLRLLHADALHFLRDKPQDWTEWKVVSNLPYSVASPILVELAAAPRIPKQVVVTLQLEVAQRLIAEPDSKEYGVLTLLVQFSYCASGFFKIPASCFFPPPDVDSGCVCLEKRELSDWSQPIRKVFFRIVKRAFSQRRKMMFKLLKSDWPESALERAFQKADVPRTTRAESVSVEKFVRLAEELITPSIQ